MHNGLSRRQALGGMLAGALADAVGHGAAAQGTLPAAGVCRLFPQAIEGPYYFDPALLRADITEGRAGLSLALALRVVDMGSCAPLAEARVDAWHADALGIYSGYAGQGEGRKISTVGETFLRGTQLTDENGEVTFATIYPGWYPGRTPHIHIKVFLDTTRLVTGQIYFPDDLSERVYATHTPYMSRGRPDTTNAQDGLFREGEREGGGMVLTVEEGGGPLSAFLLIAVDRTGEAARQRGGWRAAIRRSLGL
ncbi:MAG: intradiol ring-cleavage dioxygenase [Hyphomicrobiaceae bacterium]|nr:intradiol ring-cleavage dioxygenase [Hyphomicrobiaceae bacterium]